MIFYLRELDSWLKSLLGKNQALIHGGNNYIG